ncbi:MAG TPA: non-heme iron oxygenase ferredoxin subunit [Burkholderiaceae bacterium]|nr:non-heme iron oxygenase ferredoxin subunit [Burkholderiaceae bacterium]
MSDDNWRPLGPASALREGDVVAFELDGREIAVYWTDDGLYATDNRCTHGDARLSDGFLLDHTIECPLHQGQFDVRNGAPMCDPVTVPIRCWRVRIEGEQVEVQPAD